MTAAAKIFLTIGVLWFGARGNPLFQGLSFQRGFEINFKPLPIKPIEFIKEKWSPFGVFGRKFSIHKRSLDDIVPPPHIHVPRPAAPVFEHIEEVDHIGTGPLFIIPKPPIIVTKPPPLPPPVAAPKPPPAPLPVPMPIIVNELPPLPIEPDKVPPVSTNMVIIQPTKIVNKHVSSTRLYTDISKVESMKEHIHIKKPSHHEEVKPVEGEHHPLAVELEPPVPLPPVSPSPEVPLPPPAPIPPPPAPLPPPVPPPAPESPPPPVSHPPKEEVLPIPIKEEEKPEPPPKNPPESPKTEILLKDSSLIKGSKMVLQFGTVFLTLMAQFFDSARASIDVMTNPPPKFKP